jgi:hypothetical protein
MESHVFPFSPNQLPPGQSIDVIDENGRLYHLQQKYHLQSAESGSPRNNNTGSPFLAVLLVGLLGVLLLPRLFTAPVSRSVTPQISPQLTPNQSAIASSPFNAPMRFEGVGVPDAPVVPPTLSSSSTRTSGISEDFVVVATDGRALNARLGPGLEFNVVNTYTDGTVLPITGRRQNGWVEITNGGWVAGNLVVKTP